jgi:hypothetical protein
VRTSAQARARREARAVLEAQVRFESEQRHVELRVMLDQQRALLRVGAVRSVDAHRHGALGSARFRQDVAHDVPGGEQLGAPAPGGLVEARSEQHTAADRALAGELHRGRHELTPTALGVHFGAEAQLLEPAAVDLGELRRGPHVAGQARPVRVHQLIEPGQASLEGLADGPRRLVAPAAHLRLVGLELPLEAVGDAGQLGAVGAFAGQMVEGRTRGVQVPLDALQPLRQAFDLARADTGRLFQPCQAALQGLELRPTEGAAGEDGGRDQEPGVHGCGALAGNLGTPRCCARVGPLSALVSGRMEPEGCAQPAEL